MEDGVSAFEAYSRVLRAVAELVPGMRVVQVPGAGAPILLMAVFGLSSLNRALLPRMSAEDADEVIDAVTEAGDAAGVQVNWWLDPGATPSDLGQRLLERGFDQQRPYPVMSRSLEELPADHAPPGVELGWVSNPLEMRESQMVAGTGFGRAPAVVAAMADAMASPPFVSDPRVAVIVARIDGRIVGSGQLVLIDGVAGILNVATLAEARGRGIGNAVTVALLHEARRRGARLAALHASSMGFPIYRRMGFRHDGDVTVFRKAG